MFRPTGSFTPGSSSLILDEAVLQRLVLPVIEQDLWALVRHTRRFRASVEGTLAHYAVMGEAVRKFCR